MQCVLMSYTSQFLHVCNKVMENSYVLGHSMNQFACHVKSWLASYEDASQPQTTERGEILSHTKRVATLFHTNVVTLRLYS